MRVISILNFKGGSGKSSLAENLSHALALSGHKVLVIDADRQANASTTLLAGHKTATLTQVIMEEIPLNQAIFQARENLSVVPSDSDLDKASSFLNTSPEARDTLKDSIQELPGFDFVFFDHAGAYTPVMLAALLASREMLIPCELYSFREKVIE